MSSFVNYDMAMLPSQLPNELFSQIINNKSMVAEFINIQVQGSAFQILPFMIFV